jgi:hypothetical protein
MNRAKLTPKTRSAMKKPYAYPPEIIVPCSDPKAFTDSMKAQVGMAINAALRKAKAPTNVAITTIRKNISRNLMLTPSPHTSAQELLPHLDLIYEAARTVDPSLLPPCLNENGINWPSTASLPITTQTLQMECINCNKRSNTTNR